VASGIGSHGRTEKVTHGNWVSSQDSWSGPCVSDIGFVMKEYKLVIKSALVKEKKERQEVVWLGRAREWGNGEGK
jgi:hypothetical protein